MGWIDVMNAFQKRDQLEERFKIADQVQKLIQPTPDTLAFDKSAPDVSASDQLAAILSGRTRQRQVAPNPSLIPETVPGKPGMTTGNQLMDMLVPILIKSGNLEPIAKMAEQQADPKRQLINSLFGAVNLQPGQQQGNQPNAVNDIMGDIIERAAKGDQTALSYIAKLKMAGFDVTNVVERAQKANEPMKRTIYDPETGQTYEALYSKQGKEEIPGTRNLVKREEVQWVEEALPGGGTRKVPYRGTQRVEMSTGNPPPESNFKPFNITLPKGATQADIDKVTKSLSKSGGIRTKLPESELEIPSSDLPLWINPDTLQEATSGHTPQTAQKAGYKRVSTQAKANIDSLKSALEVQNQVTALMEKVFPAGDESIASPNRILRPISAMLQTNPDATALFNLVNGTLAPMVRSLGEKGNLSDTDIKRAQGLSLKSTDTAQVARKRVETIVELMQKIQRSVFTGGGGEKPKLNLGNKKQITRTGTYQGKKVVQYSDGSMEYAQ